MVHRYQFDDSRRHLVEILRIKFVKLLVLQLEVFHFLETSLVFLQRSFHLTNTQNNKHVDLYHVNHTYIVMTDFHLSQRLEEGVTVYEVP